MANTLLTPSVIAREALATLYAQTVMLPLVHRDFSDEFASVGDTVTVRKPAVFTANEFTSSITVQDATEGSVPVVMNKHLDVSFAVTSKELTLSIRDFGQQLLAPAMEAIAQKVDQLLLSLYVDVSQNVGTAGTTPSAISAITDSGEVLSNAKVPNRERRMAINPAAVNKFLQISTFHEADKVGDTGSALREASLGRKFGFDLVEAQNIAAHSNGDVAHGGTFAINGAVSAGAKTMAVDATTITGTWKKGSLFTVAGVAGTYVLTADATAASNAITGIAFEPAAPAGGFPDNAAVTRIAAHTPNLAFHRTAFAFVTRQLALPRGAADAATVSYKGLGLRVVSGYDLTSKKDTISVDLLCGVKTLDAPRALRLLG